MKPRISLLFFIIVSFVIPAVGQEPYYFIMLTDPQLGLYASNENFVQETANYEFAIATVNRLKPGFVIVLGDLVNKAGDEKQIREYMRISAKIDPSILLYHVAGNHDVERQPTPESLAAYRKNIGPDYYTFQEGPVYGIVLNSSIMFDPRRVPEEYEKQRAWLEKELKAAGESGATRIIVFQHHPYFLENAQEQGNPWAIPAEYREPMLDLLNQYGVQYVFAGHTHRNNAGKDGSLEVVTIAPVGMPFDIDDSGIVVVAVTENGVEHRYYNFGRMPNRITGK
jgi:3',5'-cyclic AMP phosphodiesterase CpdA